MAQAYKLSLKQALFININIMLGIGIFVNTIQLGVDAGPLGSFWYLAVGIIMLPLVLGISKLVQQIPGGTFYDFGAQKVHPSIGFLSAWSFFIGKLASGSVMIHFAIKQLINVFPFLSSVNILALDYTVLFAFIGLNFFGLKTGSHIQSVFIVLKFIPIISIIALGFYFFNPSHFAIVSHPIVGALATIPIIVYAFTGFEASCSLSRNIENPEKNAPKAILFAFAIVVCATALFQTAYYGAVSLDLLKPVTDQFQGIALFFGSTISSNTVRDMLLIIMQSAIACSALGGSFAVLCSVHWNLHVLAQEKHVFFSSYLTKVNRWNIPWLCVIIEAIVCLVYVGYVAMIDTATPLQSLNALGCLIAYSISTLALLFHFAQQKNKLSVSQWYISIGAVFSCLLLTSVTLYNLYTKSAVPLGVFVAIMLGGLVMFFVQSRRQKSVRS